jgi:hypothetical protein
VSLPLGLAALALVLVPGFGAVLAVFGPRRVPLIAAAALAFPVGYASIAVVSLALALLHVLTLPVFLCVYGVGTVVAWVAALRRHGLRERAAAWRAEVAAEPWVHGTWALLIAGFAVVRATYFPELNLNVQTALRYWADGLEIADAHRIPALSLQWGHLFPSTVSKVALNSFDATMSLVLGRGPMAPMGAVLFAVSIGAALAAYGLGRELGLRLTAGLLVLLLFVNQVVLVQAWTFDLQWFRAETFGRVLLLGGMLLVARAIRAGSLARGRREAVVAGALLGVCAGTHLVAFVVGIALAGCYVLVAFALDRTRAALMVGLASCLIAGVIGAVVLVAPGGDIGFQGTTNTSTYRTIDADLGLPKGFDATFFLAMGGFKQPRPVSGSFGMAPQEIVREYLVRMTDQERLSRFAALVVFEVGLGCVVLVLLRGDRDLRIAMIASLLLGLILLAVAVLFAWRYDIYVLSHFGPRRLFDYVAVPSFVILLAAAETLFGMGARTAPLAGRAWLVPAAASLVTLVAAAFLLPKDLPPTGERGRLAAALAPMAWIQRNIPCTGRILADRRTLATFETLTRHTGPIEGMGPYFRPDVLQPALRQLLGARAFFMHPGSDAFLRQQGVAAVVTTTTPQQLGGAYKVGPINQAGLAAAPFLQEVTSGGGVTVYRVVGFDPSWTSGLPSTVGRPGFECGTG